MRQLTKATQKSGFTRAAALLVMLLCGGCAPAPIASTVPPLVVATPNVAFAAAEASVAIPALVQAERNGAARQDLTLLSALWAEDAVLLEQHPAGDYRWQGRDEILDRYVVAVFPNPPSELSAPPDAPVEAAGERASMVNGVDQWTFARRAGRWWITGLTIN